MLVAGAVRAAERNSRRSTILQAAENIFAEKGYHCARLEDVAQRVGIRRASLVHYFRRKSDLYDTVVHGLLRDLGERYRAVLRSPVPVGHQLEGIIDVWVTFVHERPALLRILLREMVDVESPRSRRLAENMVPLLEPIATVIDRGRFVEALRNVDPLHYMMTIGGTSAFLLYGGTLMIPPGARAGREDVTVEQHRAHLLRLTRYLLGTHGPRRAPKHIDGSTTTRE